MKPNTIFCIFQFNFLFCLYVIKLFIWQLKIKMMLYNKYRPVNFEDVIGQSKTVLLLNQLVATSFPHTSIFTGVHGTGKTTLARIVANVLSTKDDIMEVDAASNNTIDDVRRILEWSRYYPKVANSVKVLILDEVHMLSLSAFNGLLKLIEEPPAYLYIMMCTTELDKVIATIKSRSMIFNLQLVSTSELYNYIKAVADKESFNYEDAALELIAANSDGSVRNAMVLLEKFSVYPVITEQIVSDDLFLISDSLILELYDIFINKNNSDLYAFVENRLYKTGISFSKFILSLCDFNRRLTHYKNQQTVDMIGYKSIYNDKMLELYKLIKASKLLNISNLLHNCASRIYTTKAPRLLVEITLLNIYMIIKTKEDGSS